MTSGKEETARFAPAQVTPRRNDKARLSRMTVWLAVFAITLIAAAPGVFKLPALDRDESRFAQASRQMLESGNYLNIRFQQEDRNKKPAGIYWLQATATSVLSPGETDQIWSYRIPSWIAVSLASLVTYWCGTILLSRSAALTGAALFGSSILATTEAHIAKTDGVLVLATTLAMTALAALYRQQGHPKRMAFLFWVAMGLGVLVKGPVTPLMAGLSLAVMYFMDRKHRSWMRPLRYWAGPLVLATLLIPWLIAVQHATQGSFLQDSVGGDLFSKMSGESEGHGGIPGFHLLNLPIMFFPATLLLIPSIPLLVRNFRNAGRTPNETDLQGLIFLLAWAIPIWVVFELLPTKLAHYVLPAYPALGLICGWGADQLAAKPKPGPWLWTGAAVFVIAALAILAATSTPAAEWLMVDAANDFKTATSQSVISSWVPDTHTPAFLLWFGLACLIATLAAIGLKRLKWAITFAIATSLSIGWHVRFEFLPAQAWLQSSRAAQEALASVCASPVADDKPCLLQDKGSNLQIFGLSEPSLVFTLGTNIHFDPMTALDTGQAAPADPSYVLVNLESSSAAPAISALEQAARSGKFCVRESAPVYAENYSKGSPVALVAFRLDRSACDPGG